MIAKVAMGYVMMKTKRQNAESGRATNIVVDTGIQRNHEERIRII